MTTLRCHPSAVRVADRADRADLLPAAAPAQADLLPEQTADPVADRAAVPADPGALVQVPAGLAADPEDKEEAVPRQSL
jgi:hypothetical protein